MCLDLNLIINYQLLFNHCEDRKLVLILSMHRTGKVKPIISMQLNLVQEADPRRISMSISSLFRNLKIFSRHANGNPQELIYFIALIPGLISKR